VVVWMAPDHTEMCHGYPPDNEKTSGDDKPKLRRLQGSRENYPTLRNRGSGPGIEFPGRISARF
jgi:hypothetical protein